VNKRLNALAQEVGFAEASWTDENSAKALKGYQLWIAENRHGPLDYLARNKHLRENPKQLLETGGKGFVVVLLPLLWQEGSSTTMAKGKGWIARYAQGRDYHKVMRKKLTRLLDLLRKEISPTLNGRALVDSAPVLERDLAVQAGLGWIGKNGLLISKKWGSHLLIGSLLIDQSLTIDPPISPSKNYCGTCRACLKHCPTQCLDEHKGLNASRCISTWSIEDDALPPASQINEWGPHLFGCDICQDVCPWNRFALNDLTDHPLEFEEWKHQVDVMEFITLLLNKPDIILSGSAMKRAGRRNLLRNALVICLEQKLPLPYNLIQQCRAQGNDFSAVCDWYEEINAQMKAAP